MSNGDDSQTAQNPAPPKLSPEDAAKLVAMQKRLAAAFGEIVSVLMRSPQHGKLGTATVLL